MLAEKLINAWGNSSAYQVDSFEVDTQQMLVIKFKAIYATTLVLHF